MVFKTNIATKRIVVKVILRMLDIFQTILCIVLCYFHFHIGTERIVRDKYNVVDIVNGVFHFHVVLTGGFKRIFLSIVFNVLQLFCKLVHILNTNVLTQTYIIRINPVLVSVPVCEKVFLVNVTVSTVFPDSDFLHGTVSLFLCAWKR